MHFALFKLTSFSIIFENGEIEGVKSTKYSSVSGKCSLAAHLKIHIDLPKWTVLSGHLI